MSGYNQYETVIKVSDINEQYTPSSETNLLKRNYSQTTNPTQQKYTGDAAITDQQIAQLPAEYQDVMRTVRDNARYLQDAPQEIEAIRKANEEQRQKENAVKGTVTNDINQAYSKMTGQTPEQIQNNVQESNKASQWNDIPEGFEMNAEGTGIVRKKESNNMEVL